MKKIVDFLGSDLITSGNHQKLLNQSKEHIIQETIIVRINFYNKCGILMKIRESAVFNPQSVDSSGD